MEINFDNIFDNINTQGILSFLLSSEVQQKLLPLRIVFFVIYIFFLGVIIYVLARSHYLQWLFFKDAVEFITFRPMGAKRITKRWNKILKRLDTNLESEYKLAVIEADEMLDFSLKKMGYMGQTLEERLQKLTAVTLSNIEEIHQAHKIRNTIVHDADYQLTLDEAKRILDIYEKAFQDLQILT